MKILAVVVRYKTALSDSETIQGLCDAFSFSENLLQDYKVLVWDNSPEPLQNPQLSIPFVYRHSARNLGVSGAYNCAMEYAQEAGYPWMLLLDQDTKISAPFLQIMASHAQKLELQSDIGAVTPSVTVRGFPVSPRRQLFNRNRPYPANESGIAEGEAIAINSGCMMRVASLAKIGGFSVDFWLDYSDLYVFHEFFLHGIKIWRAADASLEHEMSIMDYDRLLSPERYQNFSNAETAFHDLYKGRLENMVQTLRLFARAIKQRFKYKNPEFSRIAWRQWIYRISTSREQRIANWQAQNLSRQSK
jgi:GT2 family glycosyltransferase